MMYNDVSKGSNAGDPHSYVGSRVSKYFNRKIYNGTITDYYPPDETALTEALFHVEYEDGDEEDYDIHELKEAIELFESGESSSNNRKRKSDDEYRCIMCVAHGREEHYSIFSNDSTQFLPVQLKQRPGVPKVTVAYIHACCALRAPSTKPMANMPDWWEQVAEKTHGHEGLAQNRFDSTSSMFVPYRMKFSDWVDEFALMNYRMLLGSVRRFRDSRMPPYSVEESGGAKMWRCDDRGSIAFVRMAPNLVERAQREGLSPAEATLWGAIVYRCFNRLSTFSRWTAAKAVATKMKVPVARVFKPSKGCSTSTYESKVYNETGSSFHEIAASGVTLLGRVGFRDKWGMEFCQQQMDLKRPPICCVSEIPLPAELKDFATFTTYEHRQGRSVETGEHQVQPRVDIFAQLKKLASHDCAKLKAMSAEVMESESAKPVLETIRKLDTVGPFFAWQIFSDLASVQHHCQIFPTNVILPSTVVNDSLFDYALFGPGARKGAAIIDGDATTALDSESNRGAGQNLTLDRAHRIINEFPLALERLCVTESWDECAQGRSYDLETCEHSLCVFYGEMCNHVVRVLSVDAKASQETAKVARVEGCSWPEVPHSRGGGGHTAGGGGIKLAWKPHPSTTMEREEMSRMLADFRNFRKDAELTKQEKQCD